MIGCSISESADHLSKSVEFYFRDDQSTAAGFDTFVILKLDRLWLVLVTVALYCGFSLLEM